MAKNRKPVEAILKGERVLCGNCNKLILKISIIDTINNKGDYLSVVGSADEIIAIIEIPCYHGRCQSMNYIKLGKKII